MRRCRQPTATSAWVDGVILVVAAESTRGAIADKARAELVEAGATLLGIVFNKRRRYLPRWVERWL